MQIKTPLLQLTLTLSTLLPACSGISLVPESELDLRGDDGLGQWQPQQGSSVDLMAGPVDQGILDSVEGFWEITASVMEAEGACEGIWPGRERAKVQFVGATPADAPVRFFSYSVTIPGLDTNALAGGSSSMVAVRAKGLPASFGLAGVWYDPSHDVSVSVGFAPFTDHAIFGGGQFSTEQEFTMYRGNVIVPIRDPDGYCSVGIDQSASPECTGKVVFEGVRPSPIQRTASLLEPMKEGPGQ